MNTQLVKRMNTVGKVGKIITLIVFILLIIGTVALLAGAITLTALPADTVKAQISAQADVTFNKDVFGSVGDSIVDGVNDNAGTTHSIGSGTAAISAEEVNGEAVLHVDAKDLTVKSGDFAPALWMAMIACASQAVCAFYFRLLMKELSVALSPFTDGVIKRMKRFAIVLLVCAGVSSICKMVVGAILTMGHVAFSIDFGPVITALIIFVLVVVFRYGAQLQKESDETL